MRSPSTHFFWHLVFLAASMAWAVAAALFLVSGDTEKATVTVLFAILFKMMSFSELWI